MTSRYPHNSGLYFNTPSYNQVDDLKGRPTIPETFKKNDYTVMGGGKVFHLKGNNAIFRAVGTYFHTAGFGPFPKKRRSHLFQDIHFGIGEPSQMSMKKCPITNSHSG